MSKNTHDGLTRSGTWCLIAYPYGNSGRQRVEQYLDNEGSEFTVHDDIEAEYFEAGAASRVAGEARPIVVT